MNDSRRIDLDALPTEARNPASTDLDRMSTEELVRLINAEDATVAAAVEREAPSIAAAIDVIAERMARGGRLVYVGAGTSGRLGVLDAADLERTVAHRTRQLEELAAIVLQRALGQVVEELFHSRKNLVPLVLKKTVNHFQMIAFQCIVFLH